MATAAARQNLDRAKQEFTPRAKPFLKWAGGKTQLLSEILARFPTSYRNYHEPFVGGGAVFFGLAPQKAHLSDINPDLIKTYCAIRDDVNAVIRSLKRHKAEKEHYYRVRAAHPRRMSQAGAAARTIFLNRTCFNGLYRVNRSGQFNVPFGRYDNPTICDEVNLRQVSAALQRTKIEVQSVFDIESRVKPHDLVYFDPPYVPLNPTSSFTSYTREGFGEEQQRQLAEIFARLASRGVHVVLSNSDTPLVRKLYKGFQIDRVYARRAINARADRRGRVSEVIVSS